MTRTITITCQHCAAAFVAVQREVASIARCSKCGRGNGLRALRVAERPASKRKHQAQSR